MNQVSGKKESVGTKKSVPWLKKYWTCINTGDVDELQKLMVTESDFDYNLRYSPASNGSALHVAIENGFLPLSIHLLSHTNVNINFQNKLKSTATHIACKKGNVAAVRLLMTYKANFALRDKYNHLPFDYANWKLQKLSVCVPIKEQIRSAGHFTTRLDKVERLRVRRHTNTADMRLKLAQSNLKRIKESILQFDLTYKKRHLMLESRKKRLSKLRDSLRCKKHELKTFSNVCAKAEKDLKVSHELQKESLGRIMEAENDQASFTSIQYETQVTLKERKLRLSGMLGILDVMKAHRIIFNVQLWGSIMCKHLTKDCLSDKYHCLLISQGVIDVLRHTIQSYPTYIGISQNCVASLGYLARATDSTSVRKKLIRSGCLNDIFGTLQVFFQDVNVLKTCLFALQDISITAIIINEDSESCDYKLKSYFTPERIKLLVAALNLKCVRECDDSLASISSIMLTIVRCIGPSTIIFDECEKLICLLKSCTIHAIAARIAAILATLMETCSKNKMIDFLGGLLVESLSIEKMLTIITTNESNVTSFWVTQILLQLAKSKEEWRVQLIVLNTPGIVAEMILKVGGVHSYQHVGVELLMTLIMNYDGLNGVLEVDTEVVDALIHTLLHTNSNKAQGMAIKALGISCTSTTNDFFFKLKKEKCVNIVEKLCDVIASPIMKAEIKKWALRCLAFWKTQERTHNRPVFNLILKSLPPPQIDLPQDVSFLISSLKKC